MSAFLLGTLVACNAITGADGLQLGSSKNKSTRNDDDDDDTDTASNATTQTSDAGTTPADSGTSPVANPTFLDDFNRPNANTVGNGWVERTSNAFLIRDNSVLQNQEGPAPGFVVLRPPVEDAADVEVSVVTRLPRVESDPGVYARIQQTAPQELHGYSFYLLGPNEAEISREEIVKFAPLTSFSLNPPVAVGEAVKLVFRVTGENPVKLEAKVVDAAGNVRGTGSFLDATNQRIGGAGAVGFGAPGGENARYDDFSRTTLVTIPTTF